MPVFKARRSLKNVQFCSSSRKTKILTTVIHWVFRGLKSESDAEIGQKGTFCKGLKSEAGPNCDPASWRLAVSRHCLVRLSRHPGRSGESTGLFLWMVCAWISTYPRAELYLSTLVTHKEPTCLAWKMRLNSSISIKSYMLCVKKKITQYVENERPVWELWKKGRGGGH